MPLAGHYACDVRLTAGPGAMVTIVIGPVAASVNESPECEAKTRLFLDA